MYFGRLDGLFEQAFAALRPGGWLAFFVEQLPLGASAITRDFMLGTSGRYAHGEPYIRSALVAAGFLAPHVADGQIRLESTVPEIALQVAVQKPG